jgi:hypothetical protein
MDIAIASIEKEREIPLEVRGQELQILYFQLRW